MPTHEFFDLFSVMFEDPDTDQIVPPNAAVTFHAVDTNKFEGTIVYALAAMSIVVSVRNYECLTWEYVSLLSTSILL